MASTTDRPLAVVTGGSSGIGKELAKLFVQEGYDVMIAADRDLENARTELQQSDGAGNNIYAVEVDLASSGGPQRLYDEITALARPVDAICLNAGVGVGGEFVKNDVEDEVRMIELNCTSVVRLAKLVLPGMIARGSGKVLITSSIAGVMPGPYEAVYAATKAFDLQLAEAIRDELRDTGVTVTALQPGPTETNFFRRAGMEDTKVGQQEKDDPAKVAKMGFDAMMSGEDKVYAGSLKTRVEGVAAELMGEKSKARRHRKLAEPGSGHKH